MPLKALFLVSYAFVVLNDINFLWITGVKNSIIIKMHCTILHSMKQLRTDVQKDYTEVKKKEAEAGPKASYGYGGKFGVQQDRMDTVRI